MPGSVSDGNGSLQVIDSITQFINGTQAVWNSITVPIPAGLVVYATDTTVVKMGDGVTLYSALPTLFTVSSISNLTSELGTLSATSEGYATQLAALQADITALQADISGINGGSLSTQVAALTSDYNALNIEYASVNEALSALQTAASGYASATTVATLVSEYGNINTEVTTLNSEVAALTTEYNTLNASSATMATEITALQANVVSPASVPGLIQSWHNLISSRQIGVVYTNSKTVPISISVAVNVINGAAFLQVNGVIIGQSGQGGQGGGYANPQTFFAIIPPGSTYEVSANNTSGIDYWSELF